MNSNTYLVMCALNLFTRIIELTLAMILLKELTIGMYHRTNKHNPDTHVQTAGIYDPPPPAQMGLNMHIKVLSVQVPRQLQYETPRAACN